VVLHRLSYVSPAEAFVTGIKMELSDQCLFYQGIKMNPEQLILTNQHILSDTKKVWQHFCPLNPCKIKPGRFSLIKILDPSRKHFYKQYISDYPLLLTLGF